jgi:hypothetical protein
MDHAHQHKVTTPNDVAHMPHKFWTEISATPRDACPSVVFP